MIQQISDVAFWDAMCNTYDCQDPYLPIAAALADTTACAGLTCNDNDRTVCCEGNQ